MSNNLDPQKEEEIKALLKTDSIRKIVEKTGVAKNTITRIKNENLTEEEKAGLCSICGKPTYRGHHHGRSEATNIEIPPKRKYTRHAEPKKKKLLPSVRGEETMPEKTTVMFKALRRAIVLEFLEEMRNSL